MSRIFLFLSIPSILLAATTTAPALPPVPSPVLGLSVSATPSSSSAALSEAALSSSAPQAPVCINTATLQAQADSLFASASWNKAFQAYESLCPCLPRKQKTTCLLQAVRALSQDTAQLQTALLKLDSLSFATEPEDAGFGELMLTQSTLYLQANEPARALKSWKLARQVVLPGQDENLKALCSQIRLQLKDSTLTSDCNKIPVLAKQLAAALPAAPRSSASSSSNVPVATSPDGAWVLQFGAFSSKENAELLLKNLKGRKVPSRLLTKNSADRVLYLVQTEPFLSKDAALQYGNTTLVPLGLDFQAVTNP